jgi:hypothetical protein
MGRFIWILRCAYTLWSGGGMGVRQSFDVASDLQRDFGDWGTGSDVARGEMSYWAD